MTKLESLIRSAMDQYGVTAQGWRIKIIKVESAAIDWAKVLVDVYAPRKRKPACSWNVAVNMVRNVVDFNQSEFSNY